MDTASNTAKSSPAGSARLGKAIGLVAAVAALYGLAAYIVIPQIWRFESSRHPALQQIPRRARTGAGLPGDPLNLALVANRTEIVKAMLAAKWYSADPITLESSLRIAASTVLRRPYDNAPVSNLYVRGRKEDLAFEQPVGPDPRKRHHVRFWRSDRVDGSGRPLWAGSATFDIRVGFSHRTGQITHHISPDVDAERDHLLQDLRDTGSLRGVTWVNGFQKLLKGRNGGGDPYYTDGRLAIGVIRVNE